MNLLTFLGDKRFGTPLGMANKGSSMRRALPLKPLALVTCIALLLAAGPLPSPPLAVPAEPEEEGVRQAVECLVGYYEQKRLTRFLSCFDEDHFVGFRGQSFLRMEQEIERDFEVLKFIRLNRRAEFVRIEGENATYQADFERLGETDTGFVGGFLTTRREGRLLLLLQKVEGKAGKKEWKIVGLNVLAGSPIFGVAAQEITEALPDLTVANFTVPATLVLGQTTTLSAVVQNLGKTATRRPVRVRFFDGAAQIGSDQSLGVVGPSAQATASVSYTAPMPPPSQRSLKVVVDPDNEIPETNETNNQRTASLQVVGTDATLEVSPDPNPVEFNIDSLTLTVTDLDRAGQGRVRVRLVTSSISGAVVVPPAGVPTPFTTRDEETFELTETGSRTGIFRRTSIPTGRVCAATRNNGTLELPALLACFVGVPPVTSATLTIIYTDEFTATAQTNVERSRTITITWTNI